MMRMGREEKRERERGREGRRERERQRAGGYFLLFLQLFFLLPNRRFISHLQLFLISAAKRGES
jgi:hypothetical protein